MTTENDFLSNISLSIKFCHYIKQAANWSEQKTKAGYTLWCVLDGSFTLEINSQTFTISKGNTVFFYPGCRYKAYADNTECSFIFTCFSLETGNKIDLLEGNNYSGIYRQKEIAEAAILFYEKNELLAKNWGAIAFLQYMAFMNYLSTLAPFLGHQQPFYETAPKPADMRIHRVINYMHEFCLEPLTNAELASYLGMSEKYFIRFFHAQTQKTPMQYLQEYRMKHSLVLLADPANSLADVAQKLNFTDQFSFSKAFKRFYGESPSIFRKQLTW